MPPARILGGMAILSDRDIRQYLAKGEIHIEPFHEEHLTPNGYDVTIEEVLVPSSNVRTKAGVAEVPPTTRFAVSTREVVRLGRHVAGQIWLRTTWARRGVIASFGMIDAGFSGTLTFGAWNGSPDVLEVPIGDRFAQIIFLTLESPSSETYEKRSGTYQGQRGVTLDRP
jgi:dCTP deaminase